MHKIAVSRNKTGCKLDGEWGGFGGKCNYNITSKIKVKK